MDENNRYSKKQIQLSEEIYDKGFQAPGGKSFATLLLSNIKNNPKNILVFGCGTGGTVALLSYKFPKSTIIAVDKSSNMIEICKNSYNLKNVSFIQNDGKSGSFFSEQFDLIWSRDVILYIEQKEQLLTNFNLWLQYNGQIIICDFGSNIYGNEIKDYCDHKSYYLINKKDYCNLFNKTGFINLSSIDNTDMFLKLNKAELYAFEENKSSFISNNSTEIYQHFVDRWKQKIHLSKMDQLNYYLFHAYKRKKRIYVAVACDLFHYGHSTLFRNIKKRFPNSCLIVGICSDHSIFEYKNKYPIFSTKEREITIRDCKYVDETLINIPINTTIEFMKKHKIDLVAAVDNYTDEQIKEYYPLLQENGLLCKFNYTNTISTTNTLERVKKYLDNDYSYLENTL